ncbi:MAG: hypothetical protein AB4372_15655 [Xenococcus sp. (in: cyanobacteria)]
MNKLLNQAIFIIAISLIFGSVIFKPQETTTDKKLEINNKVKYQFLVMFEK